MAREQLVMEVWEQTGCAVMVLSVQTMIRRSGVLSLCKNSFFCFIFDIITQSEEMMDRLRASGLSCLQEWNIYSVFTVDCLPKNKKVPLISNIFSILNVCGNRNECKHFFFLYSLLYKINKIKGKTIYFSVDSEQWKK